MYGGNRTRMPTRSRTRRWMAAQTPRLRRARRRSVKTFLDDPPVEIIEESVDVVRLLGGHIVAHIGVLPEVEREDDREASELAKLMVFDEDGVKCSCRESRRTGAHSIPVDDGPTDAAG